MPTVTLELEDRWARRLPPGPIPAWPQGALTVKVAPTLGPAGAPAGGALTLPSQPLLPLCVALLSAGQAGQRPDAVAEISEAEVVLQTGEDRLSVPRADLMGALYPLALRLLDHHFVRGPLSDAASAEVEDLQRRLLAHAGAQPVAVRTTDDGAELCFPGQAPVSVPGGDAASILTTLCAAVETLLKTRSWPDGRWDFALTQEGAPRLVIRGHGPRLFIGVVDQGRLPLSVEIPITVAALAEATAVSAEALGSPVVDEALRLARLARLLDRPLTGEAGWLHAQPPEAPAALSPRDPLPAGQLRHLAYRRRWRLDDVYATARQIRVVDQHIQYSDEEGVITLSRQDGAERWRQPEAHLPPCPGPLTLLLDQRGALMQIDEGSLDGESHPRWRAPLGEGGLVQLRALPDQILTADADGGFQALDPQRGRPLWRRRTLYGGVVDLVAYGAGCWISGEDGLIHGVRRGDGALAFSVPLIGEAEGPLRSTPHGLLITQHCGPTQEGALTLICPQTGATRWHHQAEGPYHGAPLLHGDQALVIVDRLQGPALACVGLTDGALQWQTDLHLDAAADTPGALLVVDDSIYVKGLEGELIALDQRGQILWRLPPEPEGEALITNAAAVPCRGLILVPGATIRALDPETGRLIHSLRCEDLVPSWMHVWPEGDLLVAEGGTLAYYFLGGHLSLVG